MMKTCFLTIATAALVSCATAAVACEGETPLQGSFLNNLPVEGLERPVVALVAIIEKDVLDGDTADFTMTTVSVVEPIVGVSRNDTLVVVALDTECSIDSRVEVGQQYFISGVADEAVFDGSWPDAVGRFE